MNIKTHFSPQLVAFHFPFHDIFSFNFFPFHPNVLRRRVIWYPVSTLVARHERPLEFPRAPCFSRTAPLIAVPAVRKDGRFFFPISSSLFCTLYLDDDACKGEAPPLPRRALPLVPSLLFRRFAPTPPPPLVGPPTPPAFKYHTCVVFFTSYRNGAPKLVW